MSGPMGTSLAIIPAATDLTRQRRQPPPPKASSPSCDPATWPSAAVAYLVVRTLHGAGHADAGSVIDLVV